MPFRNVSSAGFALSGFQQTAHPRRVAPRQLGLGWLAAHLPNRKFVVITHILRTFKLADSLNGKGTACIYLCTIFLRSFATSDA
jgi:hypothetical protein